jgi:hypothetical protein
MLETTLTKRFLVFFRLLIDLTRRDSTARRSRA